MVEVPASDPKQKGSGPNENSSNNIVQLYTSPVDLWTPKQFGVIESIFSLQVEMTAIYLLTEEQVDIIEREEEEENCEERQREGREGRK